MGSRRRVSLLQRHQDYAVIDADGRSIGEGDVVRPLRHVMSSTMGSRSRSGITSRILSSTSWKMRSVASMRSHCKRAPDMELDLSAIDVGKEVTANQRCHPAAQREHQRSDNGLDGHRPEPASSTRANGPGGTARRSRARSARETAEPVAGPSSP